MTVSSILKQLFGFERSAFDPSDHLQLNKYLPLKIVYDEWPIQPFV